MPAVSLLFFGLAGGVFFAWSASEELAKHEGFRGTEAAWLVFMFSLLVFGPCSTYILLANFDWSFGYLIRPDRVQRLALPAFALAATATPLLGFVIGATVGRGRRIAQTMRLLGLLVLLSCAFSLPLLPRLILDASYAEFHNELPVRSIAGSPLGYSLLLVLLVLSTSALWTHRAIRGNRAAR